MNALTPIATEIAEAAGEPFKAERIQRNLAAAFAANRAAIREAITFDSICAHKSVASPEGCEVCGNTVEVRGYDCIACETAFNIDTQDTVALATRIAKALVS